MCTQESNKEVWLDVHGWENIYEVSSFGRIRNKETGHIKAFHITKFGYCRLTLYKGKLSKKYAVHRLVAEAFIPNPQNKPQVNHIDGNKQNNRVDNLEWVTQTENMIHAYTHGLMDNVIKYTNSRKMSLNVINLSSDETIHFNSQCEASSYLGIPQYKISRHIKSKKPIGNYLFILGG